MNKLIHIRGDLDSVVPTMTALALHFHTKRYRVVQFEGKGTTEALASLISEATPAFVFVNNYDEAAGKLDFEKLPVLDQRVEIYIGHISEVELAHGNRTDHDLLANARRLLKKKYRENSNVWLAEKLFSIDSTSARQICVNARIEPNSNIIELK